MARRVWVFDLDGCLIDSLGGTALRPGASELLSSLRQRDRKVLVWSAGGAPYARARAEALGFADLVDGFHDKAGRDASGRWDPSALAPDLGAVVFVDDQPDELPAEATVIGVFPFLSDNRHDRALAAIDVTAW